MLLYSTLVYPNIRSADKIRSGRSESMGKEMVCAVKEVTSKVKARVFLASRTIPCKQNVELAPTGVRRFHTLRSGGLMFFAKTT